MSSMPQQKPGKSEQSVATPWDFLQAVMRRLGFVVGESFKIDLAADAENTKAPKFYSEEDNSFSKTWWIELGGGWGWLNPPYSDIEPWVQKCWEESRKGAMIACLVPASTGSNWWKDWVYDKAYVTYLNGRVTFVGHKSPYPKDLVLLLYAPFLAGGSCVWKWKS